MIAFIALTAFLFLPWFAKGQILFPGSYLLSWFEPYKSEHFQNGKMLIANKPVAEDVFRHIYPFKTLAASMISHLQLPLWNPYNGNGMPLLATLNSGLIDPSIALFILFSPIFAWNLYLFLQFIFIGLFTYLYCRKISLHPLSSLLASVSFMLSGVVVTRVTLGAYGWGISMLPFLLFLIESYLIDPKTRRIYLIPFAIFTLVTSTHPQISAYILIFCSVYFFIRARMATSSLHKTILLLIHPILFLGLGLLLCAVQLLPTVELLHNSNFGLSPGSVNKFLVPWYHLISIGIPNFLGNSAIYNFWGKTDYIETVCAIGLVPLLFALFSIFFRSVAARQKKLIDLYALTLLLTLVFVLKSPISEFILRLSIPIISTDPPSRIFLLTTFALAVLSGFGCDLLLKNRFNMKRVIIFCISFITPIFILTSVLTYLIIKKYQCPSSMIASCMTIAFRNTLFEVGVFAVGSGFITLLFIAKNVRWKIASIICLIILISLSGWYNAEKFFPFSPKDTILPKSSIIDAFVSHAKDGRVFGFGSLSIATNLATYFHFYDPEYYHPLYIRRYGELIAYANTGIFGKNVPQGDTLIRSDTTDITAPDAARRERLLSLLNVGYFVFNKSERPISPADTNIVWSNNVAYIQKNQSALPRIFFATTPVTVTDSATILKELFSDSFDPATHVIVEKNLPYVSDQQKQFIASVSSFNDLGNKVSFNTTSNRQSILVMSDNYYPGWRAFIDGKPTEVYRADYTFRAILLPAGNRHVVFSYEARSVRIGLYISLATLGGLLVLFAVRVKRKG